MKKITIQSITLRNWRGEKERTTTFHEDAPTFICGDNGLGKSRHFDAFCWLLFGKDSKDRADYELRTYDQPHEPLHKCECSVEATLTIDGETVTIKREWTEEWVRPRGQVDEVFKGNKAVFTWNGVPVNKTEFTKRVSDTIIGDTLFKMLTNPRYFSEQMKWQQQREVLLQMAGTATDEEIAADNADFKLLLDQLCGKSLSDFRKEIAAEKKWLKDELDKVPTRIDEVQRNTPETEDWDAIKDEIQQKKHDIEQIDEQLQDRDVRDEAKRKERDNINNQIDEARGRQQAILRNAKSLAQEECFKANEYRRGLEASLKKVHAELSEANTDMRRNNERIDYLQNGITLTEKMLANLRKEWYDINSTVYDESTDICPTCGQRMPENRIAEAHTKFAEHKKQSLSGNNDKGRQLASQLASLKKGLEEKQAEATLLKNKVESAENGVKKFTDAVLATPAATVKPIVGENIPEWVALQQAIDELAKRLNGLRGTAELSDIANLRDLSARKGDLQCRIDILNNHFAKREQIETAQKRIDELQKRGKELAQQIADLEKREYIAAQFSKKKIEDCEQRINGMFKTVRFKLFDYTQDGNEYECCVPLINGVPYQVANTATQLNAGLDIINTLCRFNNVTAPIFVDGAESVNHYMETAAQVIFLQVTSDKHLIIK